MANQEQLEILKRGVDVWLQWRIEHPNIKPDLRGVDLIDADLSKVEFGQTDLREASLCRASLREANLSEATLNGADLNGIDLQGSLTIGATLVGATLNGALLNFTDLYGTDFSQANLRGADLSDAHLTNTDLSEADLTGAIIGRTTFGNVDLSMVKGLDTVRHDWPSTIGIDTVYASHGDIPEAFLKGTGVDDTFITYIHSLVGKPIEYYSCFISYSSKDDAFARRLCADLQSHNVRCWFAPEDLKWGERIRHGIDEAIRLHDKLLLILSNHSVASGWVEREVKTVLAREKKENRTVLFPVRVDGAVFDCPFEWATEIHHERNIGDFTRWKNHDAYQQAFTRLLRDLKQQHSSL
jgi:TIR domain/Pentapeptide repeats (8 copies)